jgi:alpha-N-arabinofuranosidase
MMIRCKALAAIGLLLAGGVANAAEINAVMHADRPGPTVDRHIFSQFSEHLGEGIYGGIWVGPESPIANIRGFRRDVVEALQQLQIPALRWPGGCFADQYHWRDGIGPRQQRPVRINANWGGVEESNAFGSHEFFDLTELLGTDAYLAVNVGSSSPQEGQDWMEYLTSDSHSALAEERRRNGRERPWALRYVGVGNESWGCGGTMTAEYYADVYRRYQTFLFSSGGQTLVKIASGANGDDLAWTETLMRRGGKVMQGLSLHNYTVPTGDWKAKGSSTSFGIDDYGRVVAGAFAMDPLIARHAAMMDRYDPGKTVGLMLDEWGVWTDPLPGTHPGFLRQQNSLRDALAAAVTLNIFAAHADRVTMANIAQTVNVLQAMILTDGPRMVLTPTYHVFRLYRPFQDAQWLPLDLAAPEISLGTIHLPALSASAVRAKDGGIAVALVNIDPDHGHSLTIRLEGALALGVEGEILTAKRLESINDFDQPEAVRPARFNGARLNGDLLGVELPPHCMVMLRLR